MRAARSTYPQPKQTIINFLTYGTYGTLYWQHHLRKCSELQYTTDVWHLLIRDPLALVQPASNVESALHTSRSGSD